METLANLESFVRSAEARSFSAAARRLALTPAAVSRNVARLEANLGVRLFQRSTRRLTLTESGERFLQSVAGGLDSIQAAIAAISKDSGEPGGTLKLSMAPGFGADYVLPLLPEFVKQYPAIQHDWHLDNRKVDLIADGFDAAISGGIELAPGVVARELARIHIVAVAAPAYFQGRKDPKDPTDLLDWDGIAMRSVQQGRLRPRRLRNRAGREVEVETSPKLVFNDPEAMTRAAVMGLGVALVAAPHALPHLESGALRRVLPHWFWDDGPISLYYPGQKLLPAKTRLFIDYLVGQFREARIAERLRAN
ncbi:LysR family transcriptional regulator [Variovorax sp. JS1663]|uniref:LysR family transcriptional regulator n=1 Tax=Variovorax sp. JS1663 TaxID=1851577 RepID=UPI000B3481CA|nr:LysR family transcriptional regulator [Variovorax sp. JS1663]OUM00016.1 LysR family transcriptional regulator [Variovorax sp. JS1663]